MSSQLLTNILLLNFIIAVLSNSYEETMTLQEVYMYMQRTNLNVEAQIFKMFITLLIKLYSIIPTLLRGILYLIDFLFLGAHYMVGYYVLEFADYLSECHPLISIVWVLTAFIFGILLIWYYTLSWAWFLLCWTFKLLILAVFVDIIFFTFISIQIGYKEFRS